MAENGILHRLMTETWPAKMAKSALEALMLPGDVYAGRVDPMSDEGIGKATDLAGLVMGGAYGMAPAGAVGMAGGRGIKGSLGQNYQPPLGAKPALTTPEALSKSAITGGGLSTYTVGEFLKSHGYEILKKEHSRFASDRFGPSMSGYLTLKTPSGETVKFRLSDHADPSGVGLGALRGSSPAHTLANIADALGIPTTPEMTAAKSLARKSFLENAIPQLESRLSAGRSFNYKGDKKELERMRQELRSMLDISILRKYGLPMTAGPLAALMAMGNEPAQAAP